VKQTYLNTGTQSTKYGLGTKPRKTGLQLSHSIPLNGTRRDWLNLTFYVR